jgi:hypothetical protein
MFSLRGSLRALGAVGSRAYLEPYKFVKASALLLSSFCNKYLQISGFNNSIEQGKTTAHEDDFTKTTSVFEKDNLGLSASL